MFRWLQTLIRRHRFETEMEAELRFHMDAYRDDLLRSGIPAGEAARRARLEFGTVDGAKEDCRRALGLRLADELLQDLRFGWRTLRGNPGFTAAALLSLALGIGANTAVFTMVDEVLLRPIAVPAPEQLYFIAHGPTKVRTNSNYPIYEAYRDGTHAFSGVAAFDGEEFKIADGDRIEVVPGLFVSGNYFDVAGVTAAHGRFFSHLDDHAYGRDPVVVISDRFWARRFNRSPDAIGQTLRAGASRLTVIGVAGPDFNGFQPGQIPDLMVPYSMKAAILARAPGELDAADTITSMRLLARLRPGVPPEPARTEVNALFQQIFSRPDLAWTREADKESYSTGELISATLGADYLRSQYGRALTMLMALVALLLLVACANVANLLMARASARQREVAVRLSLGAGRLRLVRQFLTESLMLALAGGAAGFGTAFLATRALATFFATGPHPIALRLTPDLRVVLFTAAVAIGTGLLFGLAPAFRAARIQNPNASPRRRAITAPRVLVAAQIALCFLILTAAGLLARTLGNLKWQDSGFARDGVLIVKVDPNGQLPARFYDRVLERTAALPGVRSASFSWATPAGFTMSMRAIAIPGVRGPGPQGRVTAWNDTVTAGYFETFGIRLLRGRLPSSADTTSTPRVTVINELLARGYFGSPDNALGRYFTFNNENGPVPVQIVGVVANTRQTELRNAPPMMFYTPLSQEEHPATWAADLSVRASGDLGTLATALRGEIRAVHPGAVLTYTRTLSQQIDDHLFRERLLTILSGLFAALAVALAGIGLFGVMSYTVARRTREIGIRMAIGARASGVLWMVLRDALAMCAAGAVAGIPLAVAGSRWMQSLLYGLRPGDPATIAAVLGALLAVGLASALVPARTAASTAPARALRHE